MVDQIMPLIVPPSLRHLLRRSDLVPSNSYDVRRFPRKFTAFAGEIECLPSIPDLERSPERRAILLVDISRGGVRFLCGDELYVRERVRLTVESSAGYILEVKWCRGIDKNCFQIGAAFRKDETC